jgi:hypothetical protein
VKHKELLGLSDTFTPMSKFAHQTDIVIVMSLLPHATKHFLNFLQWYFFLHTILCVLNEILESPSHVCLFVIYILPCRVMAFQIEFARITRSTCVNAG